MGWYLRKSFGIGPLKLNLSKSGLGLSAGVKGLRIGTGPRGGYLHGGREGLYYRQSLRSRGKQREAEQEPIGENSEQQAAGSENDEAQQPVRAGPSFWSSILRGIFGGLLRGR